MSVTELYSPQAAIAQHRQQLMRAPRRILDLLRRRARTARVRTDLSRLDERLLHDLGIEPLDVHLSLKARRDRLALLGAAMRLNRS